MTHFLHGLVRAVAGAFDLPEPIVEIGSYQPPGQQALAELRGLFPGKEYLGIDTRPGPGVDLVDDVETLGLNDGSVGTVLALSTFEHVRHFWRGFEEVRRVLRPNGAFLVCCPFYFHVHNYPSDYWRFTPAALELLLESYPSKLIGWHGPETRPANVWALAFREERGPISEAEYTRYCSLMGQHARQPLPWLRWLRYQAGRLLAGRRPFAPYLDRDKWQCRLLNGAAVPPLAHGDRRRHAAPAMSAAAAGRS
jgi:SAM-dependent methyltransferase